MSILLLNTIYFSAEWYSLFESLRKYPFKSNPPREIPYMTHPPGFGHGSFNEGEDWEALGVPYKEKQCWMYFVLPKSDDGLADLIQKFDVDMFHQCTNP